MLKKLYSSWGGKIDTVTLLAFTQGTAVPNINAVDASKGRYTVRYMYK